MAIIIAVRLTYTHVYRPVVRYGMETSVQVWNGDQCSGMEWRLVVRYGGDCLVVTDAQYQDIYTVIVQ